MAEAELPILMAEHTPEYRLMALIKNSRRLTSESVAHRKKIVLKLQFFSSGCCPGSIINLNVGSLDKKFPSQL